jgi:uncharacterized membrane protein
MSNKERSNPKPRLESLSDLIFGLALSIGALTLIGQEPGNTTQLVLSVMYFAFSFVILIGVWYNYTQSMALLRIETGRLLALNVLLLFLVTIEPFLFNQLFVSDAALVESVSVMYAINLGGLYLILAFFSHAIYSNKSNSPEALRSFKLKRNTFLISCVFFFGSIFPIFWNVSIPITGDMGIPLRLVFWLIPITLPTIRRTYERKTKPKTV